MTLVCHFSAVSACRASHRYAVWTSSSEDSRLGEEPTVISEPGIRERSDAEKHRCANAGDAS